MQRSYTDVEKANKTEKFENQGFGFEEILEIEEPRQEVSSDDEYETIKEQIREREWN